MHIFVFVRLTSSSSSSAPSWDISDHFRFSAALLLLLLLFLAAEEVAEAADDDVEDEALEWAFLPFVSFFFSRPASLISFNSSSEL